MWALPVALAKLARSSCNRSGLSAPILPVQGHLVKIINSFYLLLFLPHFPISQETSPEHTNAVMFVHMGQGSSNVWSRMSAASPAPPCAPSREAHAAAASRGAAWKGLDKVLPTNLLPSRFSLFSLN